MIILQGFCIATLALAVWGQHDVSTTTIYSPYNFGFNKTSKCILNMEITLKNIPRSVTAVTAIHYTYFDSLYFMGPQAENVKVNVGKKARDSKFMIQTSLTRSQTWVHVELHNQTGLCYETRITEGRDLNSYYYWNTTLRNFALYDFSNWKHDEVTLRAPYRNILDTVAKCPISKSSQGFDMEILWESGYCIAPKACNIIVDLKNTCKEQPKLTDGDIVECHIKASQYICTFVRAAKNYQYLKLYQTNEDNSVIGTALFIGPKTTMLSIKLELELFDNNTSVKLVTQRTTNIIWSHTLIITAKDISKAVKHVTILKYTEITNIQFICEQFKDAFTKIHAGFINTSENKIKTHNANIIKINNFTMADNGTILCCLFYEYQKNYEKHEITATRFVGNRTLLIYQSHESTSTNVTGPTELPVLYKKTNDESSVTTGILTGLAVVLCVAAIGGCVVILHMKKCCRVKSITEEPPQTFIALNPFYVNLLFRRECQAEIDAREHYYEEIM